VPSCEALGFFVWAASRHVLPAIETFHVKRDTGRAAGSRRGDAHNEAFPEAGSDQRANGGGLVGATIFETMGRCLTGTTGD
jgi:hypothetical protein